MRRRRRRSGDNIWPAFSDLVFNALAIFIFVMIAQFLINQDSITMLILKSRQSEFETNFRDSYQQAFQEDVGERIAFSADGSLQRISFQGSMLFDIGSTEVSPSGRRLLQFCAQSFINARDEDGHLIYDRIQVEGYTDRTPLHGGDGCIRSNWDLSVMRAISVVETLTAAGVDPGRLSGAGYGEFQAVHPPSSPAERLATDRKIELVLFYSLEEILGSADTERRRILDRLNGIEIPPSPAGGGA